MTEELKTSASSDALHAVTARLLLAAFALLFVGGAVVAALRPSEVNRRCLQGPLTGAGITNVNRNGRGAASLKGENR